MEALNRDSTKPFDSGKVLSARVALRTTDVKGSGSIVEAPPSDISGMFLLFAAGKRPDRLAIKAFAEEYGSVSVSFDPSGPKPLQLVAIDDAGSDPDSDAHSEESALAWVELLREGLTFDMLGLANGQTCDFPEVAHTFDIERVPTPPVYDALKLVPGRHISGAQAALPVARGMMAIARDLIHHFDDLEAVIWPPSDSAIGRRYFESVVTAWLEGGPFPAIGLTAFKDSVDGALQSVGLDFWIGQELRIEQPLAADKIAATRLGVRIINQLILVGRLEESERLVAPDGTRLVMRPSPNRKYVRVSHE